MKLNEAKIVKSKYFMNKKIYFASTVKGSVSMIVVADEEDLFETNFYHVFLFKANKVRPYIEDIMDALSEIPKSINQFPDEVQNLMAHEKVNRERLYYIIRQKFYINDLMFKKIFGFVPISKEDENIKILDGIEIQMPEKMKEKRKKELLNFIEKMNNIFNEKGLGQYISGKIIFTKLPGDQIGNYVKNTGEILMNPETILNPRTLKVLLHEFGHKYWFEILNEQERNQLIKIHDKMKSEFDILSKDVIKNIKTNDILVYDGDREDLQGEWKITSLNGSRAYLSNNEISFDHNLPNLIRNGFYPKSFDSKTHTKPFISHSFSGVSEMYFPTQYSENNIFEWFAEIFTLWLTDQLKGGPKELLDKFLG